MLRRENVKLCKGETRFPNRASAGEMLVEPIHALLADKELLDEEIVVLGLPKGGVTVSSPVAEGLGVPLDLVVTRKLHAPNESGIVIGGVTERGQAFLNKMIIDALQISDVQLKEAIEVEKAQIRQSVAAYREVLPQTSLTGKTIILVDDNVITGSTVFATLRGLWAERPKNIILAVPVGPKGTIDALSEFVDYVVVLCAPDGDRVDVKSYYDHLEDATEQEVIDMLVRSLESARPM